MSTVENSSASSGAATPPPQLPDLNAGPLPFQVVQEMVDRAAWLTVFSVPEAQKSAALTQSAQVIGVGGQSKLHRCAIDTRVTGTGLKSANIVGQIAGELSYQWLIIPEDFQARPDRTPPATPFDPSSTQRFAMQEARFSFAGGRDGFNSFGTGRIFPIRIAGQTRWMASAVGNVMDGFGAFAGLEGNYVLGCDFDPQKGFVGNITIRIVDPDSKIHTSDSLPPVEALLDPDPEATYVAYRSQKEGPDQLSTFSLFANGQPRGINVPLQLRRVAADFTTEGSLRSHFTINEDIGTEVGFTATNPLDPGPGEGSATSPFYFQGSSRYAFMDANRHTVGGMTANFIEGRTFAMQLQGAPQQPALRFGYFGPIIEGTGCLIGINGLLYGTAGVAIGPHVFSNLYVARIIDPTRRLRAS